MSYKFKEVVEESIIHFYDHVLSCNEYTEDVFEELDHVYAQAAKADEYEAKAKAFDDSLEAFEELRSFYEESRKPSERSQIRAMIYKEVYSNVLREMKLILEESGESEWMKN